MDVRPIPTQVITMEIDARDRLHTIIISDLSAYRRRADPDKERKTPVLKSVLHGLLYLVYISVCVEVALQGFYYVTAGDFLFRRFALPIFAREPYAGFGNRPGLFFDHRTNESRARYITR